MLRIEARASYVLVKCSVTERCPQPRKHFLLLSWLVEGALLIPSGRG
jgi:hypothetical protein